MAFAKTANAALSANADTLLITPDAGNVWVGNVSFCNRGTTTVKVRLAIGTGSAPATTDYLSYDRSLVASGEYERSGITLLAGEKLWVRTDTATVSARAHGLQESA